MQKERHFRHRIGCSSIHSNDRRPDVLSDLDPNAIQPNELFVGGALGGARNDRLRGSDAHSGRLWL